MRELMLMLMSCLCMVACGPMSDGTVNPVLPGQGEVESGSPVEPGSQVEVDPASLSIDLGYITLLDASQEGVLYDTGVDRVTVLDGQSNEQRTQISLISEPDQEQGDSVIMGLLSFEGDLAGDLESITHKGLGCAGNTIGRWNQDQPAGIRLLTIDREVDLITINYEMDFRADEWLMGTVTLTVN